MSKSTAGFTKAAQAAKFVRNRDIQLKDKELRKEAKISKESAEGVCKRCREKAQWRFKYDKYKPLKTRGNCQACKQKTIVKAYRTFCDPCAAKRKCCPGCTTPNEVSQAVEAELEKNQKKDNDEEEGGGDDDEMDEEDSDGGGEVKYTINTKKGPVTIFNKATAAATVSNGKAEEENDEMEEEDDDDEGEDEDEDEEQEEDEEDEEEGEAVASEGNTKNDKTKPAKEISEYQQALNNAEADLNTEVKMMDMVWDERKFTNMAASKYSKNRVVGAETDSHFFVQK